MARAVTRALTCLIVVGLLSPAATRGRTQQGAGLGPTVSGDIVLRARDMVDLRWDPIWGISPPQEFEFVRWEVHRGSCFEDMLPYEQDDMPGWDFYRDKAVEPDTEYCYGVYVVLLVGGEESAWRVFRDCTTTDALAGKLYLDLTLKKGVQPLRSLSIADDVTLEIRSGTTVSGTAPYGTHEIHTGNGRLEVDGARFVHTYLDFGYAGDASQAGGGWVRSALFEGGGVNVYGNTENLEVAGNSFEDSDIAAYDEASILIQGNNTGWFRVWAHDDASLTVSDNRFRGVVFLYDQATATVERNAIAEGGVNGQTGSPTATIVGNIITGPGPYAGIWARNGDQFTLTDNRIEAGMVGAVNHARLTAHDNTIVGPVPDLEYDQAMVMFQDDAEVEFTDNWVSGGAIRIDDQVTGRVERNTIQNDQGFKVWEGSDYPALRIRDNCIQLNDPGLWVWNGRPTPIDVRQNWWGHERGPNHPTLNPGGLGDRIEGDRVLFDPWSQSPTNCLEEPPEPPVDLSIAGLEVVQVIQDLENSVPLVAARHTVVRVYPDYKGARSATIIGRLTGIRDDQLLSEPRAIVGSVAANRRAGWDAVRGDNEGALLWRLPDDWLEGTVTVKAQVWLNPDLEEVDPYNNTFDHTAVFQGRRPLRIGFLPIEYQGQQPDYDTLVSAHDLLRALLPTGEVRREELSAWELWCTIAGPGNEAQCSAELLGDLQMILEIWNRRNPDRQLDQLVGLFPGAPETTAITYSRSNPRWKGGAGRVAYSWEWASTVVHEIGHNLGLRHPDTAQECATPPDPDSGWPYDDSTIQEYGYYVAADRIIPADTHDLMAACHNEPLEWLSPFNYKKLFSANGVPPDAASESLDVAVDQTTLLVRGMIFSDGSASFRPFWQITTTDPPTHPPAGGDICLELRDAGDAVLTSHCFDASFHNYESGAETDVAGFFLALPLAPGTARVVLQEDDVELGAVAASDRPPTVTLIAPNGGETPSGDTLVSWHGEDGDGDELAYNLLYSADDGASWRPLTIDFTGATTYTLDLSQVPGGAACRLRVEASDGFHTAADESDGSFSVPDNAPHVAIQAPRDSATVIPPLNLSGSGYDLEDGELDGAALVWASDRDGFLGVGDILWDVVLTSGEHTLTLTGTDSHGGHGSDSAVITVEGGRIYLPLVLRQS